MRILIIIVGWLTLIQTNSSYCQTQIGIIRSPDLVEASSVDTLNFTIEFSKNDTLKNSVSGTIVDDFFKEIVIGAKIYLKGTSIVTNTDISGHFKLILPDSFEEDSTTLVIQYTGLKTKEIILLKK
ncbi:MAG: carboxypeptidase-like regulatory domain-containing protein [Saprospiraceae bacterium]